MSTHRYQLLRVTLLHNALRDRVVGLAWTASVSSATTTTPAAAKSPQAISPYRQASLRHAPQHAGDGCAL
jgi:hypothetical protein